MLQSFDPLRSKPGREGFHDRPYLSAQNSKDIFSSQHSFTLRSHAPRVEGLASLCRRGWAERGAWCSRKPTHQISAPCTLSGKDFAAYISLCEQNS
eukprot:766021-Hanusia_phi.AAC.1